MCSRKISSSKLFLKRTLIFFYSMGSCNKCTLFYPHKKIFISVMFYFCQEYRTKIIFESIAFKYTLPLTKELLNSPNNKKGVIPFKIRKLRSTSGICGSTILKTFSLSRLYKIQDQSHIFRSVQGTTSATSAV